MTSQLSAVMTAMGASKPMDALAITCAIDVLRDGKGDRITFVSDDELGCGVVLCTGAWTGWEQRAFTGATAFEALLNALADHNRLPHGLIDLQGDSLDPQVEVLKSALQWLLDDMHDAGETHDEGSTLYDSVEHAAAALVEAGGTLNWYTAEDARNYRVSCEAEDGAAPVEHDVVASLKRRIERLIDPDHRVRAAEERAIAAENAASAATAPSKGADQ